MTDRASRFPNVLIRASAGTGKTFQLSNRYLALVAAGEPVDAILASTFTRKAAGEILDRILTRLAEAASDPAEAAKLAAHTGASDLDAPRCLAMLRDMVRRLHRIRTGTLDSFFMQIARSFALELGLPLGWTIINDVADANLRSQAVRNVLADQATDDVVKLMHLLTKGEAARSVSQQIGQLVNGLYNLYTDSPREAWYSLSPPKPLPGDEVSKSLQALAALNTPKKSHAKARDADLDAACNEDWEAFLSKGIAAKVFADEDTYSRSPIAPDFIEAYKPLVRHARAVLLTRIAHQTEATWRLLDRFDKAYQRLKTEHRALRFEDVTRRLGGGEVIERLEDVVFRLDGHVSHLLLDEFQDTSPQQWRVLRPLAGHVTGKPGQRTFFCVGDVKQAIYGWRGGVAEIFEALRQELPGLEPQALNQSFRSSPVVIDTVNRVFQNLTANAVLQNHAAAAERWGARFDAHSTARRDLGGHCRLQAAPLAENCDQAAFTLKFAASEIARMHAESPGRSIGVLVRRNQAVARMIYELRALGVHASEEGGNPLTDSPAVQLLLSLLTMADHPGDTAARFHVTTSSLGPLLDYRDHADSEAACRLADRVRRQLCDDGYGPTVYGWVRLLADSCDRRDLKRLKQLVSLAYTHDASATTRPTDFVRAVEQTKVEDPTSAHVRVMNVHQSKGLQFDIVVLPELDARLVGQTPEVTVGRSSPTGPVERVCRYVSQDLRPLLPAEFCTMFDDAQRQVIEEALCVLYVALTRAVHALHMIVAPSRETERNLPSTYAGLLRASLTDGTPLAPGTVAYEHGDPCWFQGLPRPKMAPPAVDAIAPIAIRLADAPQQRSRGLDRRSPAQLEGADTVRLAHQLRLDSGALSRGTLLHAWFARIEWLEEGMPGDRELRELAADPAYRHLDVAAQMAFFHEAIDKPAICEALRRTTYQRPSPDNATAVHATPKIVSPQWQVWRERSFAVRDGDAILSGSIDRLVVLFSNGQPVGADILDFKTDHVPPSDPGALDSRAAYYRPQLDAYRRAVSTMFRLAPDRITARLAFLVPGVVYRV